MNKRIYFIGIVFSLFLQIIGGEILAQNTIDPY